MTSGTDVAHGEAHQGTTTLHPCMNILDSSLLYLSTETRPGWPSTQSILTINFEDILITLLKTQVKMRHWVDEVLPCNREGGEAAFVCIKIKRLKPQL